MASPLTATRLSSLLSRFGESGTYTPNGGGGSTVSALVDRGILEISDDAGNVVDRRDVLTFKRSDLDPPARNARWTNGTDTWVLGDIVARDEDTVRVEGKEV